MDPASNESIRNSMLVNGGYNSGCFSVNNYRGTDTDEIYRLMSEVRRLLSQQDHLADESGAESALDEFDEALTDRDLESRYDRLRNALSNLRTAVGGAVASAVPFAQLATAIDNLIQPKH